MARYTHTWWQKKFGTASDRVLVVGGAFYLVSRPGTQVSPAHQFKFGAAMQLAQQRIQAGINALGGVLTPAQQLVFRYCFNPPALNPAPTIATVTNTLQLTLQGLQVANLQVVDVRPSALAAGAQGYVSYRLGSPGRIHTDFNLSQPDTALNLIHEGSHLFARTLDHGYIARGVANYIAAANALAAVPGAVIGAGPVANELAVNNADSIAAFAMNV